MRNVLLSDLTLPDHLALGWFIAAWLGYGAVVHALRWPSSIASCMRGVRRAWMHSMLGRDNRITDASLLGSSMHSATFFASTTMVALAAMISMLGHLEQTYIAIEELTFTAKTTKAVVELKILLLAVIFAHSFIKLTWALRQMNYCVALVGAAPLKPDALQRQDVAKRASLVLTLAVSSSNAGIRGYYFALAALAWLFGPGAFAVTTTGMVMMLAWRQIGSATAGAIRLNHLACAPEDKPDAEPIPNHQHPRPQAGATATLAGTL